MFTSLYTKITGKLFEEYKNEENKNGNNNNENNNNENFENNQEMVKNFIDDIFNWALNHK